MSSRIGMNRSWLYCTVDAAVGVAWHGDDAVAFVAVYPTPCDIRGVRVPYLTYHRRDDSPRCQRAWTALLGAIDSPGGSLSETEREAVRRCAVAIRATLESDSTEGVEVPFGIEKLVFFRDPVFRDFAGDYR